MTIPEKIQAHIQKLPMIYQAEVLDFVEYLLTKTQPRHQEQEETIWKELSLVSAMRGMEDEDGPSYTNADIKETFL